MRDTRVDFYLLAGDQINQLRWFCCRLTEKAWKLGHRIWIRTDDASTARLLDDLLWSYQDGSFLPHARLGEADAEHSPVLIGEHSPAEPIDLLINLAADVPPASEQYARIAELVNDDATRKQQGRARYSYYDKNNYTLEHHKIN